MLDLCALLELDLDFAEEGLDVISTAALTDQITSLRSRIASLASSYAQGRIYRDGVSVVLAGEPNAGKSSLFNALLKQDRAIVTPVPGTTRDALEESIVINGVLFRLTDTAGLVRDSYSCGTNESSGPGCGDWSDIVLLGMDAAWSRRRSAQALDAKCRASRKGNSFCRLKQVDLLTSCPQSEIRES